MAARRGSGSTTSASTSATTTRGTKKPPAAGTPSRWDVRRTLARGTAFGGLLGRAMDRSPELRQLLTTASAAAPLTSEEERAAARAVHGNSVAARQRAIDVLVMGQVLLAAQIATAYAWQVEVVEDLVDEALVGATSAARDYDGSCAFATFAIHRMRARCSRYLHAHRHAVRLPYWLAELVGPVRRYCERYEQDHGAPPGDEQVAADLALSIEHVQDARAGALLEVASLDTTANGNEPDESGEVDAFATTSLGERLTSAHGERGFVDPAEHAVTRDLFARVWRQAKAQLSPDERAVLALRFGLLSVDNVRTALLASSHSKRALHDDMAGSAAYSLRECGDLLGMSGENVRLTQERALAKLRTACLPYLPDLPTRTGSPSSSAAHTPHTPHTGHNPHSTPKRNEVSA